MPSPFELTDEQFRELMRCSVLYRKQADKCRDAKSYLASCVMIGAALEAELVAICHLYSDEISAETLSRCLRRRDKPLLNWTLSELVNVARACDWLPAGLSLDEEWDQARAKIGDYAEVVRQTRNLVHVGCYLRDFAGKRVAKRRAERCFEILEVASDYLVAKINTSLRAAFDNGEL